MDISTPIYTVLLVIMLVAYTSIFSFVSGAVDAEHPDVREKNTRGRRLITSLPTYKLGVMWQNYWGKEV